MKIQSLIFTIIACASLACLLPGDVARAATADDKARGLLNWQLRDDVNLLQEQILECEDGVARITALEARIQSLEAAAANNGNQATGAQNGETEGLEHRIDVLEQVISMMEVGQGSLHARIDQVWVAVRVIQKLFRLPVQP